MYGIGEIVKMNRDVARKAKGKTPYIAKIDGDEGVFGCLNFGSYRPKGWKKTQEFFVDNSGWGGEDEPALTVKQFLGHVKTGMGYAIISTGQFQIYIGEFVKK